MNPERPVLYGYWRSTAAYRVRIALHLKGIDFDYRAVDLVRDGGAQHDASYRALNPSRLVPTLVIDGHRLGQSLAICEYLDEVVPQPALLPADPAGRAWVRALALDVACDIHPLNNLRVQQHLKSSLGLDGEATLAWMDHWMRLGFETIEARLAASPSPGACALGENPGLADICLVAQVYNAERFGTAMDKFERIMAVVRHCRELPAFRAAAPENQPDAPAAKG